MADEIDAWGEAITATRGSVATRDDQGRLVLEAPYFHGQALRDAPRGAEVVLRGAAGNPYVLLLGPNPPMHVTLEAGPDLSGLEIQGGPCAEVTITRADRPEQAVNVRLLATVLRLNIEGAAVLVEAGNPPEQVLSLKNGTFQAAVNWPVRDLVLNGVCRIHSGNTFERTRIRGLCLLTTANSPNLGEIVSDTSEGEGVVLRLLQSSNPCSANSIPDGSRLELEGAHITFTNAASEALPDMQDLVVAGAGTFGLSATTATRVTFEPEHRDALTLDLTTRGAVWDAHGSVGLRAARGTVCAGDPNNPITLISIHAVEGAELEKFSPFELRVEDLGPLSNAERVDPWFPRRRAARELESKMELGGGPAAAVRRKRAHFWQRLSRILAGSHASGGAQSAARFAAMDARRQALDPGREKTILGIYSIVGYGERIALPFVLLVVLSLISTLLLVAERGTGLCCERSGEFFLYWYRLLLSPLAFFRFTVVPEVRGLDSFIVLVTRVVGTLLLFFGLAAARRVAKAEP